MSSNNKIFLKVIIVGDKGVGKTSIINQFVNKKFSYQYSETKASDYVTKILIVDDYLVTMQIHDVSGKKVFKTSAFYRDVHCCIIVYDVRVLETFFNLEYWRDEVLIQTKPKNPDNFPIIVIGNKVDCESRKVTIRNAMEWCKSKGDIPYFECCAKEGLHLEHAFQCVARSAIVHENEKSLCRKTIRKPRQILKIIIIGDSEVGKSSLIHQFTKKNFSDKYTATIGTDFLTKDIVIEDNIITMQLWDTAGQERFQSAGKAFYSGADSCLLVYDVTSPKSFESLTILMNNFLLVGNMKYPEKFPFIVAGNKMDLADIDTNYTSQILKNEGNIQYFMCSAKESLNIEQLFEELARAGLTYKKEIDLLNNLLKTKNENK